MLFFEEMIPIFPGPQDLLQKDGYIQQNDASSSEKRCGKAFIGRTAGGKMRIPLRAEIVRRIKTRAERAERQDGVETEDGAERDFKALRPVSPSEAAERSEDSLFPCWPS